jgi:hypothetical protein
VHPTSLQFSPLVSRATSLGESKIQNKTREVRQMLPAKQEREDGNRKGSCAEKLLQVRDVALGELCKKKEGLVITY